MKRYNSVEQWENIDASEITWRPVNIWKLHHIVSVPGNSNENHNRSLCSAPRQDFKFSQDEIFAKM
jgi:hypothetical protein